ncbi:hypothetical protein GIB67_003506 [Kingdonia uniflora]|uniref:Prefoldin subunit 5 n=1 Tax=Kingdonia uniflora TaxID=39325 RepID=A0A7J7MEJ5_9MAGN|nr:hypothetical protein GIB67_003506 [Kingdonia uniflora]
MEKMSIEQLKLVKEQSDMEVNLLQDSLNNIRTASIRLEIASNALNELSLRPQGKKMLVPLTASLYVPGTLDDAHKVLVDVGTGYFIEKTMVEGKDYCDRKINLLRSNYDQLVESVEPIERHLKASVDVVDTCLQDEEEEIHASEQRLTKVLSGSSHILLRIDPIRVQKSPKPVDHAVLENFKAKNPPVVFNPSSSTTSFVPAQLRTEPIKVQKSEDFKVPSTNSYAPIQLRIDPIRVQKSPKPVDHAVLENFKAKNPPPVVFNPSSSTTSFVPAQLRTEPIKVQKSTSPVYAVPEDFKDLIKNDIVPQVLRKPLSPSTYNDYFAALLYAEDYYIELIIDPIRVQKSPKPVDHAVLENFKAKNPPVVFNPSSSTTSFVPAQLRTEPIKVQKSEDFKVPSTNSYAPIQLRIDPIRVQKSPKPVDHAVLENFKAKNPPVVFNPSSSTTSFVPAQLRTEPIKLRIYPIRVQKSTSPINAVPEDIKDLIKKNLVPQVLRKPLSRSTYNDYFAVLLYAEDYYIEDSVMFRANAAFRDFEDVPDDILSSCTYKGECFTCPSLKELKNFKVIISTFVSSFRLHNEGISAGHASHIFLVDASSAIEQR